MFNSPAKSNSHDMKSLVHDAQKLLQDAAKMTGEQADEARSSALQLLDSAVGQAHQVQSTLINASKDAATFAQHYVEENPWRTISIAASIGLLLGVVLGRSK